MGKSRATNVRQALRRGCVVGGLLAVLATASPGLAEAGPVVHISSGKLRGIGQRQAIAFLGIPYGDTTAGANRFKPPLPAPRWHGIRDAAAYGPKCPQVPLPLTPRLREVLKFADVGQSEDCLSLNVWTPAADSAKRPVVVWLHGGGFTSGTGAEPDYEGANLAHRGDVVVVTLNHRLNIMGHLDLSAWGPAYAESANAGMLDIVLALRWVRENIGAFGGDPANVTIFGQSGGGMKASVLLAMPVAKGLFGKAVIISGPEVLARTAEASAKTSAAALQAAAIAPGDVHALQSAPLETLLKASATGPWGPVVDGKVLPAHPFSPAAPEISRNVPVIIGNTADEGNVFLYADPRYPDMPEDEFRKRVAATVGAERADAMLALYRQEMPDAAPAQILGRMMADNFFGKGSVEIAERRAAQGAAPTYMYRIAWNTPVAGVVLKAAHGIDMPLWFDNADHVTSLIGTTPQAQAMSTMLSQTLVAFARTGNPNSPALPHWPAYSTDQRAVMIFDVPPHVQADPRPEFRKAWSASPAP